MFKPGDKVRFNSTSEFFTNGKIYVVSKLTEDYVYVENPDDRVNLNFKENFILVKKYKRQKFYK